MKTIPQSVLRAKIANIALSFPTQQAAAIKHGLSPQQLSEVMHGRRDITDAIARKFGYRQVERSFEKIENGKEVK